MTNFEDYLSNVHADQYTGLDDEMPEDYEEWLQDLDAEEWIEYGNKFAFLCVDAGTNAIIHKASTSKHVKGYFKKHLNQ